MEATSETEDIFLDELIYKIRTWFYFLKRQWKIFVIVGVISGIAGYTYAYLQKPVYTAKLTFALEDDKGSAGGLGGAFGLASSLGFDLGGSAGGAFSGSNLIELMKSRKVIEETLLSPVLVQSKTMSLAEMYILFNNWRNKWQVKDSTINQKIQFLPDADRSKFSLQQDSVLGIIYSNLLMTNLSVIQKDKKVSIINIEVISENELFSKFFTERIAKIVSDFYINTKSIKAKANVEILERQVDSIRSKLNDAITGVAIANDNTYNLNPALNINRTPSSKRQVDVQANLAILTELVKNLELAKVALRKETPLIQVIDKPILPLLKTQPSKLLALISMTTLSEFITLLVLISKSWWDSMKRRAPKPV